MHFSLLATRTRIPPHRPHLLSRDRLTDTLECGIPGAKLALISAPAGYGKTTLLSQWARASRFSVAWLSLAADDNDIERLLRYLVTAWDEVQPGIKETPVGLLLGSMSPDLDAVLSAFINVGSTLSEHTVFVLDDCHLIENDLVYQSLAFLIDHLPPTLHFAIASRGQPPLPLARYRARGELLELETEDLHFRQEETRAYCHDLLAGELSDDALAPLQAQLEGWAAGLQLVCHAIRRRPEAAGSLSVTGKQRFIADYLNEEVLANLDGVTRQFLLQTSILNQLHGELCDATTGRNDSQSMLEMLERDGLFLAALDEQREWFRYHSLFAGVLREELQRQHPQEVASLHCRAARWYLDRGMPEQAFNHAVAGNDVVLVTRIAEDYCVIKMESGELNVVAHWLQMIPEAWFASYPAINFVKVCFLVYTGELAACALLLDEVEDRVSRSNSADKREQLAKFATARCAIACFQNDLPAAEAYAAKALGGLPGEERFYRASIYHALGETYGRNAYWDQARDALVEALNIVHEPSFRIRSVHIFGALADLELRQGHLEAAAGYWRKALAVIQERELWGRLPIPVTGWVSIRMAELLYERNRLADARAHLSHGLELARLGGDVRALIAGNLLSGRLSLAEGDIDRAAGYLEQTRSLLEQAPLPEWLARSKRYQLELWLAQDRLRAVANWADAAATSGVDVTRDESDIEQLTLSRALIAKGHTPDREQALAVLRDLIAAAVTHGRKGILIEALALEALALWAGGDRSGALIALERSLSVAEPEGYARIFADLGLPMARLLQEAQARQVMLGYVRTLLAAFAAPTAAAPASARVLPEPLSAREQDVLRLIAAGLTNREIAAQLFISPETVKKHTGSIYTKLDVAHRTQAVVRARELHLLNDSR